MLGGIADTDPISHGIAPAKRHFKALDGLRGVAALAVVNYHFIEMAAYGHSHLLRLFVAHGFLAVDFFFCLSGFVIGYAYDDRIATMGLRGFLKVRLIRLHPLVVLGSVLGLAAFLADPFRPAPLPYNGLAVTLLFLASVLLIPFPVLQERSFNLFGLNAPAWSLFWEYVANVAYALVVRRFNRFWLAVAMALAACGIVWIGHREGVLVGGWNGFTFWDGGVRMAYSFLAGLLIYRSRWIIRSRLGFAALAVLLLLALGVPYVDGGWIREAAVVLVYFPLLIALGAGATLSPRSEKVCTFFGEMSYPLYMTHYCVIWIFGNYYDTRQPGLAPLALLVAGGLVTMVGVAYLAMTLYDTPVRRWLRSKLERRRA